MRLIDADAFREDYALGERCEDCRRFGKKDCDYPAYSARDFCGWLDDAPTVDLPDALRAAGWKEEGWISVKNRLPEREGKYLCWFGGHPFGGFVDAVNFNKEKEAFWWYEDNVKIPFITHWMPLPEPPKEE